MRPRLLAPAICLAACGRVGFEEPVPEPALGTLACGERLSLGELPAVPLGLDFLEVPGGALVAWTGGQPAPVLSGVRLAFEDDTVVSAKPWQTQVGQPIGPFGLATDGGARYLLGAQLTDGALFLPLGEGLAADGNAFVESGLELTSRGVADPILSGGAFATAPFEGSGGVDTLIERRDAKGLVPPEYRRPAMRDVAIRRAAGRHILVWATPSSGCSVWALDAVFQPVLPDPIVHAPGGSCREPAVTRHEAGVNLLVWIDAGGRAQAQLGSDTASVGPQSFVGDAAHLDIAAAPSGFFIAAAGTAGIRATHMNLDGTQLKTLPSVPHLPGAPLRLISHGDSALLATIEEPLSRPKLWLTRFCE